MFHGLLAHTGPFIRNKGAAAADSGSAGSAPACYPRPPLTPTVFSVSGLSVLDLTISVAISPAKSLATITTAQLLANTTLVQSGSVPGCTISLTGSTVVSGIQIAGTPTTAGDYEVTLTCIKSDTCETLGGMVIAINVIDPSILLVVGSCASASLGQGLPADVLLCSPSIAMNWDVTAHPNAGFQGMDLVFAWTAASPTSSGTLRITGTPTAACPATTLTVTYRHGTRVLGTSVHTVSVTKGWVAAPPAPAPAPAPAAPAPTPAPTAAPAPLPPPIPGADSYWANVLALYNFEYVGLEPNVIDPALLVHEAPVGGTLRAPYAMVGIMGGAAGLGSIFSGTGGFAGSSTTWGAADRAALAAECMVMIDDSAMALLTQPAGTIVPIFSTLAADESLVWALALLRVDVDAAPGSTRAAVFPAFIQGPAAGYDSPVVALGPEASPSMSGYIHLAGQWSITGSTVTQACWWNGTKGDSVTATKARAGAAATVSRVAGACPPIGYVDSIRLSPNIVLPLTGGVDEARVTAAVRYSLASNIAESARVIPWPTY